MLNAFVLKELHHLLGHHHEATLECEATGNDVHLHSIEYQSVHCFLCNVNLSPTEEEVVAKVKPQVGTFFNSCCLAQDKPYIDHWPSLPSLRGPPVQLI